MAAKVKKSASLGKLIKSHLNRNQRWLAKETGMREPDLSEKLNDLKQFTQEELDKINSVLQTNYKLDNQL